jgi:hypothetical protein
MKDYQKAYDTSNQVIALGYSLDPDFNHLFRPAGEFGSESVLKLIAIVLQNLEVVNMQKFKV